MNSIPFFAVPLYPELPTTGAHDAHLHSTPPFYIMIHITRSYLIDGIRLYQLFHSTIFLFHLASLHHTKCMYSTPCLTMDCWGQVFAMHCYFIPGSTRQESNIMSAFPSIPCWYSSMIWWGGKAAKEIEAEVWWLHEHFFLCCTKILCAPHCSGCWPNPISFSILHNALHHK